MHTVADEVFATRIDTDRVDYRYARHDGGRVPAHSPCGRDPGRRGQLRVRTAAAS
ncbi:hypothetical protein ACFV0O_02545 [Kitasatospora sp. NPDC059577]|uniref:hypothetical protein n=1 Tax=unclassified Kitasatospora TaxID=2633591 RepID=UPI00368B9F3B